MPKIILPSAEIVNNLDTDQIMQRIEESSRISHRSEDKMTDDSWKRFIQAVVIDHADWSVVEHVSLTVDIVTDRGITHELVRHRMASYTQESTRFVNYEKKMPPAFVYPKSGVFCNHCLNGDEPRPLKRSSENVVYGVHKEKYDCAYEWFWYESIGQAEEGYKALLYRGWRPQEARSVLPNALAAKIRVTTNLRAWREIFLKRVTKEAHPQMLEVMEPLLAKFKALVPLIYDDIAPGNTQINNLRLPH